ncbi:MAG: hypothetical protein LBT47_04685 [Deltaproteobacteria bacterium]|jgi:hypothetical protein|nr:hypothetical protein [Deltaproteobacteria bacterium]
MYTNFILFTLNGPKQIALTQSQLVIFNKFMREKQLGLPFSFNFTSLAKKAEHCGDIIYLSEFIPEKTSDELAIISKWLEIFYLGDNSVIVLLTKTNDSLMANIFVGDRLKKMYHLKEIGEAMTEAVIAAREANLHLVDMEELEKLDISTYFAAARRAIFGQNSLAN